MTKRWTAALAACALLLFGAPANAAVTITFWSHEGGGSFPHTFFTLYGTPDAGGTPVDGDWGFTAVEITPAILLGNVQGKLEGETPGYLRSSDAHFSVVLSDAQYAAIVALTHEWGPDGDHRYNLNKRNCVTFVREAARRAGVATVDFPKLMKKPGAFLAAVAAANPSRVAVLNQHGDVYFAAMGREPPPAGPTGLMPVRARTTPPRRD